jgi:hypothetical protein
VQNNGGRADAGGKYRSRERALLNLYRVNLYRMSFVYNFYGGCLCAARDSIDL